MFLFVVSVMVAFPEESKNITKDNVSTMKPIDILSEARIARIIDTVLNLEKLEKISDLTKLLISHKIILEKEKKKYI